MAIGGMGSGPFGPDLLVKDCFLMCGGETGPTKEVTEPVVVLGSGNKKQDDILRVALIRAIVLAILARKDVSYLRDNGSIDPGKFLQTIRENNPTQTFKKAFVDSLFTDKGFICLDDLNITDEKTLREMYQKDGKPIFVVRFYALKWHLKFGSVKYISPEDLTPEQKEMVSALQKRFRAESYPVDERGLSLTRNPVAFGVGNFSPPALGIHLSGREGVEASTAAAAAASGEAAAAASGSAEGAASSAVPPMIPTGGFVPRVEAGNPSLSAFTPVIAGDSRGGGRGASPRASAVDSASTPRGTPDSRPDSQAEE